VVERGQGSGMSEKMKNVRLSYLARLSMGIRLTGQAVKEKCLEQLKTRRGTEGVRELQQSPKGPLGGEGGLGERSSVSTHTDTTDKTRSWGKRSERAMPSTKACRLLKKSIFGMQQKHPPRSEQRIC